MSSTEGRPLFELAVQNEWRRKNYAGALSSFYKLGTGRVLEILLKERRRNKFFGVEVLEKAKFGLLKYFGVTIFCDLKMHRVLLIGETLSNVFVHMLVVFRAAGAAKQDVSVFIDEVASGRLRFSARFGIHGMALDRWYA